MTTVSHIPGASGTTTGCSVCRWSLLGALGGRTGAGSLHTIGGGGPGREAICGGAELIVGGAELGGGNIIGALGCRDGVRTSIGLGIVGDIIGGKTFAGGDATELKKEKHKMNNIKHQIWLIDLEAKNHRLTIQL